MYSPVGTVVFDALLIVENINDFATLEVNFDGNSVDYGPYSINSDSQIQGNPLITISLDEALNLNDDKVDYNFAIEYVAFTPTLLIRLVNIIIHEIGK